MGRQIRHLLTVEYDALQGLEAETSQTFEIYYHTDNYDTLEFTPCKSVITMNRASSIDPAGFLQHQSVQRQLTKLLLFLEFIGEGDLRIVRVAFERERDGVCDERKQGSLIDGWSRLHCGPAYPPEALEILFEKVEDEERKKSRETIRKALSFASRGERKGHDADTRFRDLYSSFNGLMSFISRENNDCDQLNELLGVYKLQDAYQCYCEIDERYWDDELDAGFVGKLEWPRYFNRATDSAHWLNRGNPYLQGDSVSARCVFDSVVGLIAKKEQRRKGDLYEKLREEFKRSISKNDHDVEKQFLFVFRNAIYQERCQSMHGQKNLAAFAFDLVNKSVVEDYCLLLEGAICDLVLHISGYRELERRL